MFPAIDPLQSSSKMSTPGIVGERHYALAREIRRTLAEYDDLKDIIAMPGLEQLSPDDRKVVARARRLERFLADEFAGVPESALHMIGKVDEAKAPTASPASKATTHA